MSHLIGVIEEISRRGTEELCVEWQIPNLPSLLDGRDDWYRSPEFEIVHERWWLSMRPNWKREERNPASGWVRLVLDRCDFGPPKTFLLSVGIRGSGGVEKSREGEKEFSFHDDGYWWNDFCSRSELVEHRTRLMPDDTLTVTCVLKRSTAAREGFLPRPHWFNQVAPTYRSHSSDKRDACTQTDCNLEAEALARVQESTVKRGGEKALEDLCKLLDSGEDSDITMQVGDVEFKVHRAILFARSPVLAAMFRHETEERASNRIVIEDCDPDVFREYLQYLYTGSVRSLTEQTIFGLYHTADKYLAEDLKQLCLEHIRATLSVQTFCEAVKLALTHRESGLLQLAINFATKNIPFIIISVEWQNFIREFPTEANEILIKCIKL